MPGTPTTHTRVPCTSVLCLGEGWSFAWTHKAGHTHSARPALHPPQKLSQSQLSTAGGWARAMLLSLPRPSPCWLTGGIHVRREGRCCSWACQGQSWELRSEQILRCLFPQGYLSLSPPLRHLSTVLRMERASGRWDPWPEARG